MTIAGKIQEATPKFIKLSPEDWFWATWRNLAPLPKPEPRFFDVEEASAMPDKYAQNWPQAPSSLVLSTTEALFWFAYMTGAGNPRNYPQLAAAAASNPNGLLPFSHVKSTIAASRFDPIRAHALLPMQVLTAIMPLEDLMDWLIDAVLIEQAYLDFRKTVIPYLTPAQRDAVREKLLPKLTPTNWRTNPTMGYFIGAGIGMNDEVKRLVEGWQDGFADLLPVLTRKSLPSVVFGLGSADEVKQHFRRLRIQMERPEHDRAWIAHTECSDLAFLGCTEGAFNVMTLIESPEVAPFMLEFKAQSRYPHLSSLAQTWLRKNPRFAATGLLPLLADNKEIREEAKVLLRQLKREGHGDIIRDAAKVLSPQMVALADAEVLQRVDFQYECLTDEDTPDWLKSKTKGAAKKKKEALPEWILIDELPAILVGHKRLNDEHVNQLLVAMKNGDFNAPPEIATAIKNDADTASVDRFAWSIFESWLAAGAQPKDKWAMMALGFLGSDAVALQLTPLIRKWPGESQHGRSVLGLDCLRAIGTDTALMQISGISQKVSFKGVKSKASECIELIANDRGLSREELEDRIVPTCDLDEGGKRIFDFGPRQFEFRLSAELKPMVRDSTAKLKPDLPKPAAKDDGELARVALEEWKLLKQQIKEVAKIQSLRLESAMITGRRWSIPDFETFVIGHPLMIHLARMLLWASYSEGGKLNFTFRVTEDSKFADVNDRAIELTGIDSVGIVHPLHMTDEERNRWTEISADYEIVPPFPQLARQVYRLEDNELNSSEIKRLANMEVPGYAIVGVLDRFGWLRGTVEDGGTYNEHVRHFRGADVTAVVQYEPGIPVYGVASAETQKVKCFFLKGLVQPGWGREIKKALPLSQLDPVTISEVLGELTLIAAKVKPL